VDTSLVARCSASQQGGRDNREYEGPNCFLFILIPSLSFSLKICAHNVRTRCACHAHHMRNVVTYFEESVAWVSDEMSRCGESYTSRQRNRDLCSERDMAWLERMLEEEKDEGKKKEDLHLRSHGGDVPFPSSHDSCGSCLSFESKGTLGEYEQA
jgi:hypothetical protein